jgi:hypothetical protein
MAPSFSDMEEIRDIISGVMEYGGCMIVSYDTIKGKNRN